MTQPKNPSIPLPSCLSRRNPSLSLPLPLSNETLASPVFPFDYLFNHCSFRTRTELRRIRELSLPWVSSSLCEISKEQLGFSRMKSLDPFRSFNRFGSATAQTFLFSSRRSSDSISYESFTNLKLTADGSAAKDLSEPCRKCFISSSNPTPQISSLKSMNLYSLLYIEIANQPGLLLEIIQIMADININVESAEIETEGLVDKDKFRVSYRGAA